jgi:hypothetical protein
LALTVFLTILSIFKAFCLTIDETQAVTIGHLLFSSYYPTACLFFNHLTARHAYTAGCVVLAAFHVGQILAGGLENIPSFTLAGFKVVHTGEVIAAADFGHNHSFAAFCGVASGVLAYPQLARVKARMQSIKFQFN